MTQLAKLAKADNSIVMYRSSSIDKPTHYFQIYVYIVLFSKRKTVVLNIKYRYGWLDKTWLLQEPVLHFRTLLPATAFLYSNPCLNVSCYNNGAITPNTRCDIVSGTRHVKQTNNSVKCAVHTDQLRMKFVHFAALLSCKKGHKIVRASECICLFSYITLFYMS